MKKQNLRLFIKILNRFIHTRKSLSMKESISSDTNSYELKEQILLDHNKQNGSIKSYLKRPIPDLISRDEIVRKRLKMKQASKCLEEVPSYRNQPSEYSHGTHLYPIANSCLSQKQCDKISVIKTTASTSGIVNTEYATACSLKNQELQCNNSAIQNFEIRNHQTCASTNFHSFGNCLQSSVTNDVSHPVLHDQNISITKSTDIQAIDKNNYLQSNMKNVSPMKKERKKLLADEPYLYQDLDEHEIYSDRPLYVINNNHNIFPLNNENNCFFQQNNCHLQKLINYVCETSIKNNHTSTVNRNYAHQGQHTPNKMYQNNPVDKHIHLSEPVYKQDKQNNQIASQILIEGANRMHESNDLINNKSNTQEKLLAPQALNGRTIKENSIIYKNQSNAQSKTGKTIKVLENYVLPYKSKTFDTKETVTSSVFFNDVNKQNLQMLDNQPGPLSERLCEKINPLVSRRYTLRDPRLQKTNCEAPIETNIIDSQIQNSLLNTSPGLKDYPKLHRHFHYSARKDAVVIEIQPQTPCILETNDETYMIRNNNENSVCIEKDIKMPEQTSSNKQRFKSNTNESSAISLTRIESKEAILKEILKPFISKLSFSVPDLLTIVDIESRTTHAFDKTTQQALKAIELFFKLNSNNVVTYNSKNNFNCPNSSTENKRKKIKEKDKYNYNYDSDNDITDTTHDTEDSNDEIKITKRNQIQQLVLPPEYDPYDSKWTLQHHKASPGLVELVPDTGVYINNIKLSNCKRMSKDYTILARTLLTELFTQNALSVCSLTGAKASAFKTEVRPGLDENARSVLLRYVKEYGHEQGWGHFDLQAVLGSLRSKIQETRAKHGILLNTKK